MLPASFDPFTAKDFYSFAAVFEDINDKGYYAGSKWEPTLPVPTADQTRKLEELDARAADVQSQIDAETPELVQARSDLDAFLSMPGR